MEQDSTARLASVNVVYQIVPGNERDTAIDKRPVDGPTRVEPDGLAGDTQCDRRHHGGPDKAVYAYAAEDSAYWASELGRDIPPGTFGENLTTTGLDVTGAVIGERWQVGGPAGVVLEVRQPRSPCANLSFRMGIPKFHFRFDAIGKVGAYLKVITPGTVRAGDVVTVIERPDHGVSVGQVCALDDLEALEVLRNFDGLCDGLRGQVERRLRRAGR